MTRQGEPKDRPELSPAEVGRGLRLLMWDAGLSTVKVTLTAGAFLAGFALWLGASDRQIGFIMAVASLAQAAQLVAPRILQKARSRRRFAGGYYGAGESAWVPITLLALLTPALLRRETALPLLVALVAVEGVLMAIAMPAGVSLMQDIIPHHRRGRFLSKRNMLMAGVAIGVSLLGGPLLDYMGEPKGFAPIYLIGYLCGMGGVLCVASLPERPHILPRKPMPVTGMWLEAWRHRPFREFLIYVSAMWASMMIAGPFFTVYLLKDIKLNYGTIALYAALGQIASMTAMPFWGYLSDKFGHTPVLKLSSAALVIAPFVWIPATAEAHRMIPVAHIYANAVWAGVMMSQFNLLLAVMPGKHDTAYSGVFYGVTGIVSAAAPVIGGFIAQACSGLTAQVGFVQLRDLHFLFMISACLRALSLLLFRPKHTEARTTAATFVLRKVVSSNPFRAFANILAMQLSVQEAQRVRATRALGVSRSKLAVEELVEALNDASPDVRREAARALGDIGDERAVGPLLARLALPGEGIVDECARALGRIGDPRSVEPLLQIVADPTQDTVVRSRALLSLGDLGARAAVPPALEALESGPLALAASAATALSHLGEAAFLPKLVERMRRSDCPVARRQFAEAVARLIGRERQIGALFRHDAYAVSEHVEGIVRRGAARLGRQSPDAATQPARAVGRSVAQDYGAQAYGDLVGLVLPLARQARDLLDARESAPNVPGAQGIVRRAGVLVDTLAVSEGSPEALEEEALLAVLALAALTDSPRSASGTLPKGNSRHAAKT